MSQLVIIEYRHNNSGGYYWLGDKEWTALQRAGWKVDRRHHSATITGLIMAQAIENWERATKFCATDRGCDCCGKPHLFLEDVVGECA